MRLRINWLAPLPPAKNGVAHYTRDLLPLLAQAAEVHCFTPQSTWDRDLEAWATVSPLADTASFWRQFNRADCTICHLGNDPLSFAQILEVASRHPSLLVLHHVNLFRLVHGLGRLRRDPDWLRQELGRWHGRESARGLDALHAGSLSIDELAARHALTELVVDGALGVFCHRPDDAADAETACARQPIQAAPSTTKPPAPPSVSPTTPVAWHGLPAPRSPEVGAVADRKIAAQATDDQTVVRRLIAFGHFPPDHLLAECLDALACYPRRRQLHLDLYGDLPDHARLIEQRDRLALQPQVLFHGFVVEPALLTALSQAELVLDLRRPEAGGGSAVRLRAWRHGIPCLAAAGTAGSDGDPPAVRTIHPSHLTANLHRAWDDLLDRPECFLPLVHNGRDRLAREHQPSDYVRTLLDFAEQCRHRLSALADARLERRRRELTLLWPAHRRG